MPVYPVQLPESIRNDQKRNTEIMLYDLFKTSLPEDCSIIYSAEWICNFHGIEKDAIVDPLTGERPKAGLYPLGEIDFILVASKGLLVIEVKGGEITVENGTWLRRDMAGIKPIESPLSQARRNMFALLKTLKHSRRFHGRFLTTGYTVILPHTPAWHQGVNPGLPRQLFLYREDVNNRIVDSLKAILNFWEQTWKSREPLKADDIKDIVSVFAPTVQLRRPQLRRNIEKFQAEVLELTESQFGILKSLSRNKKALITGGAGTGKTLLAMEKARQTATQGHRTLFTCANRLLAKHVKDQLAGIENLEVMNFHELCYTWGKESGMESLTDPDGPERNQLEQEYYDGVLPTALVDAAGGHLHPKYDAIIVDEAQDMADIFWTALQFCFTSGEEGIFYIFFDPEQSIWHLKERLPFEEPCFLLTKNLRNSVNVFNRIKALCTDSEYEPGCEQHGRFSTFLLRKGSETIESKLHSILMELIQKDKVPHKDIAVLTGRSRNKSQLAAVNQIGKYSITRELNDTSNKILFSSIRQFRGMESPVVILVELEFIADLDKLKQELKGRASILNGQHLEYIAKETLLIGISRAQHTLYILADADTTEKLKGMGLTIH